jgi:hypothetical protein
MKFRVAPKADAASVNFAHYSCGSFATLAAMRRASSRLSSLAVIFAPYLEMNAEHALDKRGDSKL